MPMMTSNVDPFPSLSLSKLSVEEYQKLVDETFDALTDSLEDIVQAYEGENADELEVEYSVSGTGIEAENNLP
jgi:hypothetical protein